MSHPHRWIVSLCFPHSLKEVTICDLLLVSRVPLVVQMVKNLPVMRETWFCASGWEDPLEEGMATPVFLPEESRRERNLADCSPWGHKESDTAVSLGTAPQL